MLLNALLTAARRAIRPRGEKWIVEIDALCRGFKEEWLYSNKDIPVTQLTNCSGSFVILFHKNLSVTNTSLLEVVSLLRLNTNHTKDRTIRTFDFFSDEQYTRFFKFLWQSSAPATPLPTEADAIACMERTASDFVDKYRYIFETTIIMNIFFTSALIHIPKSLKTNVRNVAYEAGYIHSIGPALFVRNIEKAREGQLLERIRSFLAAEKSHPVFVTPYADEFFSPHEKDTPVSIRNGLDGVRLQLRKHYIDGKPLLDFLGTLPPRFNNAVIVPKGFAHYQTERRESITKHAATEKCSMWFITDASITHQCDEQYAARGHEIYLIVYAQYFLNDNQFIAMKERKPGWYASVTLPHTLSIACINIARPHLPKKSPVILDPFCGSGTTLIDAALRIPDATVIGFDRERLAIRAIEDNLEFFSLNANAIQNLIEHIEPVIAELKNGSLASYRETTEGWQRDLTKLAPVNLQEASPKGRFLLALALIYSELENARAALAATQSQENVTLIKLLADRGFSEKFHEVMNSPNQLAYRILVYAIWRALALGTFSLRGDSSDISSIIAPELERLIREFKYVAAALGRITHATDDEGKHASAFQSSAGLYSSAGTVRPQAVEKLRASLNKYRSKEFDASKIGKEIRSGMHLVQVGNSVDLLRDIHRKVDLIVTDPPYGFNTVEGGSSELRQLFVDLIPACIDALRPGGQMLLVLPAFARNGRQIPFFETQGMLVREIISAGARSKRNFKQFVETFPGDKRLFDFPLYWKSASVLERRIIRFTMERD